VASRPASEGRRTLFVTGPKSDDLNNPSRGERVVSGAERCDEVLRLIDEVLADVGAKTPAGRSEPRPAPVVDA
jgi:hypothetical protein